MNCKRIVALLLTVVILFSVSSVPASASYVSPTYVYTDTSLDDLLVAASYFLGGIPFLGPSLQTLAFQVSPNNVCPISSDTRHSGSAVRLGESPGGGGRQCPVVCLCDYCGAEFTVYVQRSELAGAFSTGYDTYIDGLADEVGLPYFVGMDSAGYVHLDYPWSALSPLAFRLSTQRGLYGTAYSFTFTFATDTSPKAFSDGVVLEVRADGVYSYMSSGYVGEARGGTFEGTFTAPMPGYYTFLSVSPWSIWKPDTSLKMESGDEKALSISLSFGSDRPSMDGFLWGYPSFEVLLLPSASLSLPSASSRPASIMQTINNYNNVDNSTNYYIGTVDAGGDVSVTYSPFIFAEDTKVFTEPVTGAQYQCKQWAYDYNTRTYTLDLTSGTFTLDEQDITQIIAAYGDDKLTLQYYAGSTLVKTDEYAYVVAEKVDPTTCAHTYTETTTTAPTCTAAGVMTYTCSKCGNTYTAPIPALGHDWRKVKTVDTAYNEDGSVADYSYTLYQCATCKEEYKDYDQTGPPSEDSNSGFFAWWKEAWTSFVSTLQGWFDDLKDAVTNSGGGDTIILKPDPGVDGSDGNKTDGFTFLDLLGGLVKGVWGICKGVVRLGGTTFSGFIEGLNGLPDGFGVLDPASSEGIFYVDTEGSDSW